MVEQGMNRRITDGQEAPMNSVGELKAEIRSLSKDVRALTDTVSKNTEQLSRLSLLEANHSTQADALERAFGEIKLIQAEIKHITSKSVEDHSRYDRSISFAIGFAIAISCVWSVAGYRINAQLDDVGRAITEMRMHIATDKITNEHDVRSVTK